MSPRVRGRLVLVARVLCRTVLVAGNAVAIHTTTGALLLDGEHHPEGASIMAVFGVLFAAMTGLVTLAFVWLVGRWWLVVPAVVFVVAFTRGCYLDIMYPEPSEWGR